MTIRELIDAAGAHPLAVAGLALAPPVVAFVVRLMHPARAGGTAPWRYLYAVLVYVVCVPGVGAAVLTAYTLFFTHENLLDKNVLVYLLPIVSMGVTLAIIAKAASFDDLPGFDRLSGLMTLVAVTFLILLVVHKTFVGIFFGASITMLFVIGAFLFALLKWGAAAAFRGSGEPRPKPPTFPVG
jgi:hypothetical protein